MTQKYCTIDEDELKELMAKVAGIQAWIRNDANIEEIRKRVNVLEYLLQKIERKLTKRAPDSPYVCLHCGAHISSEHLPWCKSLPQNGGR